MTSTQGGSELETEEEDEEMEDSWSTGEEDAMEESCSTSREDQQKEYSAKEIQTGLERVCEYLKKRAGKASCLNIDGRATGSCSCAFRMMAAKEGQDKECHIIATWFSSTKTVEEESKKKKPKYRVEYLTKQYKECVNLKPQNNGKQYTKKINFDVLLGMKKGCGEGNWNGHNWDVEEELRNDDNGSGSNTRLCVPTLLTLWKFLVGGKDWDRKGNVGMDQWRTNNYPHVLVNAGVIAEQIWKQRVRQRLFYARVEDYMDSGADEKNIGFVRAYEKFKEMQWVDGSEVSRAQFRKQMAQNWYQWHLGTIHIVRGDSSMAYGQGTKAMFDNMGMKVCSITEKNCDFLEELFLYVMKQNEKRASRVARDKKLLYVPFESCVDIRTAIAHHYGDAGEATLRGDVKYFVREATYAENVTAVDNELREKMLSMLNSGRREEDEAYTNVAFQTSLIMSDVHKPQEAHVDYDLCTHHPDDYLVAFLPLTDTGQFLQFWECGNNNQEGKIVFIPRGQLLMVPGGTIHGGGFRADHRTDNSFAHMRLHFYVYPGATECPFDRGTHKNDYIKKTTITLTTDN
jgi:hypothetical protein